MLTRNYDIGRYEDGNKVHIETVGETRMRTSTGFGQTNETNANWNLEYNNDAYGRGGLEGDVETLENGKRNKYRLQMDNEDLSKIFSAPHEQGLLNKRLMTDFQMPMRSQQPVLEPMMFIEERPPIMDESLMQIVKMMQQQQPRHSPHQRSRRMRIDYSSGPRSHRHTRAKRRRHKYLINPILRRPSRRRRRRSLRIRKPISSKRQSLRSNVPLTELND